jgi:peroxiredoxin Q/BCP
MPLEIGSLAPIFDLPTDGGGTLSLISHKGKKVVLYFYPKDMTPGCTKESEEFRDRSAEFEATNTIIMGVSKDSVKRHDKFKAKYHFPFTLISDEEGMLCEAYDVWRMKKLYGKEYMGIVRSTYLIDESGYIQAVWDKVRVKGHVDAVLEATQSL